MMHSLIAGYQRPSTPCLQDGSVVIQAATTRCCVETSGPDHIDAIVSYRQTQKSQRCSSSLMIRRHLDMPNAEAIIYIYEAAHGHQEFPSHIDTH